MKGKVYQKSCWVYALVAYMLNPEETWMPV